MELELTTGEELKMIQGKRYTCARHRSSFAMVHLTLLCSVRRFHVHFESCFLLVVVMNVVLQFSGLTSFILEKLNCSRGMGDVSSNKTANILFCFFFAGAKS